MLIGSYVLAFFGISLPIVRVAGGLVVIGTGWRLLHSGNIDDQPGAHVVEAWERELARRGFYPLTFPLTVGPGSITIAITLGAREVSTAASRAVSVAADLVGIAIIAISVYLCYRFASRVISSLGETATNVFLRLSAFIMLSVGVSIFWAALSAWSNRCSADRTKLGSNRAGWSYH